MGESGDKIYDRQGENGGNDPWENKAGVQFDEKEEYVRRVFAAIARRYDTMNRIMTGGLVKRWYRYAVAQTRLETGGQALDVGTGTGEIAFLLAGKAGPQGRVVGVDLSGAMLDIAREKLKARFRRGGQGLPVSFLLGNALALPFPPESFDCVITGFTLRNVADIPQAVREMVRVCKKGGRVVCLEIAEPQRVLARAGFRFYFYVIIPWLGRLVDRGQRILGRSPAYTWLSESLRKFPQGEEMVQVFREAGLERVDCHPLSFGVVTVYTGIKKESGPV